jgi:serine protease Do
MGSPFGLQNTITAGIVSAKSRQIGASPYDDFIQTDASINPGNSGGPLINMQGEVVGINTAIFSRTGGNIGIGFAIPINVARELLPELKTKGKVTRGWLGVAIQRVTPEIAESLGMEKASGALVANVSPGSPAERAGIRVRTSLSVRENRSRIQVIFLDGGAYPCRHSRKHYSFAGQRKVPFTVTIADLKEERRCFSASEKGTLV